MTEEKEEIMFDISQLMQDIRGDLMDKEEVIKEIKRIAKLIYKNLK